MEGLKYETSRLGFAFNYLVAIALTLLALYVYFSPSESFWRLLVFYGSLVFIAGLILEPEFARISTDYMILKGEVVKTDGLLSKKRVAITYQGISGVRVKQGILGRILGYGTVEVIGAKDEVEFKNVKDPKDIENIIRYRIQQSGMQQRVTVMKREKEEIKEIEDIVEEKRKEELYNQKEETKAEEKDGKPEILTSPETKERDFAED